MGTTICPSRLLPRQPRFNPPPTPAGATGVIYGRCLACKGRPVVARSVRAAVPMMGVVNRILHVLEGGGGGPSPLWPKPSPRDHPLRSATDAWGTHNKSLERTRPARAFGSIIVLPGRSARPLGSRGPSTWISGSSTTSLIDTTSSAIRPARRSSTAWLSCCDFLQAPRWSISPAVRESSSYVWRARMAYPVSELTSLRTSFVTPGQGSRSEYRSLKSSSRRWTELHSCRMSHTASRSLRVLGPAGSSVVVVQLSTP